MLALVLAFSSVKHDNSKFVFQPKDYPNLGTFNKLN